MDGSKAGASAMGWRERGNGAKARKREGVSVGTRICSCGANPSARTKCIEIEVDIWRQGGELMPRMKPCLRARRKVERDGEPKARPKRCARQWNPPAPTS